MLAHAPQRSHVAVHGEGAVGGDEAEARAAGRDELRAARRAACSARVQWRERWQACLLPQVGHVHVIVTQALGLRKARVSGAGARGRPACLAETDAVDDGGVIERVRDDGVVLGEQSLEDAGVRVEARRVQDGVLRTAGASRACGRARTVPRTSMPWNSAMVRSSFLWMSMVPQMKRTELRPCAWRALVTVAAAR